MEQQTRPTRKSTHKADAKHPAKTEVYVKRDWKEYLGESALIVFSVLLALFLTEWVTGMHEKEHNKEVVENIKAELIKNKDAALLQYNYETAVLKRIDSAIASPALQAKIIVNGEFHLNYLAPEGVINRDLSRVAWQVAQSQNVTLKMDLKLVQRLTHIYDAQARIDKLEEKIADVILSYNSRNPADARATLILLRDNYHGWAYDRAKTLINEYGEAIKAMPE